MLNGLMVQILDGLFDQEESLNKPTKEFQNYVGCWNLMTKFDFMPFVEY